MKISVMDSKISFPQHAQYRPIIDASAYYKPKNNQNLHKRIQIPNISRSIIKIKKYKKITIQENNKKMRSKSRINNSISFVEKLLNILEDPDCQPYVEWIDTENGFNITNVSGFSQNVLPTYFKHQNYSSFVRQLNMYGFTKVRGREGDNIYEHRNFKRGSKTCIKKIQRKVAVEPDSREGEIVLYRPGGHCDKKKKQDELEKLREKQIELQRKCISLLQRNKELLQQNEQIVSAIKSQQHKKKLLLEQIVSLLFQKSNPNQIEPQPYPHPQSHPQPYPYPSIPEQQKQKQSQMPSIPQIPINILDPQEEYLKLDDFMNIDYDELSQVFRL